MKIDKVTVEESMSPRGIYNKPRLTLQLAIPDRDQLPNGQTVYGYDDEHVLRVQGKKYSFLADLAVIGFDDQSLKINRYFRGRPWFEVSVNFLDPNYRWYIPLDRARSELKKRVYNWELVVDDAFAVQGELVWRLREISLTCKAPKEYTGGSSPFCMQNAVTEVRWAEQYYIPLCREHHDLLTAKVHKAKAGS